MNNLEMFKKAHELARGIVDIVGNYAIAFQFALKKVWAVKKASEKKLNHNQFAVMANCGIFSEERRECGISESITCDEIDDVEERLKPFFTDGTLTARQYFYAVWYCLIGKKAVDRLMWRFA